MEQNNTPQIIGYTRDHKGHIVSRHIKHEANTLHASTGSGNNTDQFVLHPSVPRPRIRKLTPTECFRLMGVSEPDIQTLLHCGLSNTRLYKLAGNSIVVDVMFHIFRNLFTQHQPNNHKTHFQESIF